MRVGLSLTSIVDVVVVVVVELHTSHLVQYSQTYVMGYEVTTGLQCFLSPRDIIVPILPTPSVLN